MAATARRWAIGRGVGIACGLALFVGACEKAPPSETRPASPIAAATSKPVAAAKSATTASAELRIPAAAQVKPRHALGAPTNTFVDRARGTELRLISYNTLWNSIFPEKNAARADKFVKVMRALNPDVMMFQEVGKPFFEKESRDWSADDIVYLINAILPPGDGQTWYALQSADSVTMSRWPFKATARDMEPRGDRPQAMTLIDLPDGTWGGVDLYVLNNHYKCCEPEKYDARRQEQSDAIVNWLRDARTPGGHIDLPERTAFVVGGDLNIVGSFQPVTTLVEGDVQDEAKYGPDIRLDWDDTALTDLHPLHNVVGPEDYTWREDSSEFKPGRLDFIIYTDSVLEALHKFVLDTGTMSEADLAACGLSKLDGCTDDEGVVWDHYPLVVDFKLRAADAGQ